MIDIFEKWRAEDFKNGLSAGQNRILTLNQRLLAENRIDDLRRASTDNDYLQKLLDEEGIGKTGTPTFWRTPRP